MSPTTEELMKLAPIRASRLAKELSLRGLAKLVGVSQQAIANYENGENTPGPEIWQKLKDTLELDGDIYDYFEERTQGRPVIVWDGNLCAFEDCARKPSSHGLCSTHYVQYCQGKPLKKIGEYMRKHPPICKFPGCEEPHRSMGYCNTHYHQSLRGNGLQPIKARILYTEDSVCNVLDCKEKPYARGLCNRHYRALRNRVKKLKNEQKSS